MLSRMRELCDDLGPDDGIDPRELKRQRAREARRESPRKTHQLCGQVARATNLSLGASEDPLLQQLVVDSVEPFPDASRLRVVVTCHEDAKFDVDEILARLSGASGWLRSEAAAAIHRKRAPDLTFAWRSPWGR